MNKDYFENLKELLEEFEDDDEYMSSDTTRPFVKFGSLKRITINNLEQTRVFVGIYNDKNSTIHTYINTTELYQEDTSVVNETVRFLKTPNLIIDDPDDEEISDWMISVSTHFLPQERPH